MTVSINKHLAVRWWLDEYGVIVRTATTCTARHAVKRGKGRTRRCGVAKFAATAGQPFGFGETGVLDGATAKSLAAGRHGPRQVGQIARRSPSGGAACGFWIRASELTRARNAGLTGCL